MSLHRRNPRRDENEPEITEALRSIGAMVEQNSAKGRPDLHVIYRGQVREIEVKGKNGKLTPAQKEYHARALEHGYVIPIVRTIDEALQAIGAID